MLQTSFLPAIMRPQACTVSNSLLVLVSTCWLQWAYQCCTDEHVRHAAHSGRPQPPPTAQSEAVRAAAAAVADAVAQEPARPIVRNRRIERLDAPTWEAEYLPFDPLVRHP